VGRFRLAMGIPGAGGWPFDEAQPLASSEGALWVRARAAKRPGSLYPKRIAMGKTDTGVLPSLHVGTAWTEVELISDVTVRLTFQGYAPVVAVRVTATGLAYWLFISAKSLAESIEPLRQTNGGFCGLRLRLRKESTEKYARYEVESLP
jgi:hypothetical protein